MNNFGINMTGEVADTEPIMPPVDLDPIEYVQHIRKVNPGNNGRPIDIRKARQMTRADLLTADPRDIELLFGYGVPQKQLAKIYNVPMGSLAKLLKQMGVDTSVPLLVKEKFDVRKPENEDLREPDEVADNPDEIITDPVKIAEIMSEPDPEPTPITPPEIYQGFTWFYGAPKPGTIPILTVMDCGKVSFPIAIRKQYIDTRIMVGFKGSPDNLIVAKTDNPGIGLKPSLKQAKIRCNELAEALVKNGIELPAKYKMTYNKPEQMWSGVLMP